MIGLDSFGVEAFLIAFSMSVIFRSNLDMDILMLLWVKIWAGVLAVTRLLLLWHSANRATRALGRCFIGDCLPFPLAGRPFHRFQVGALDLTKVSSPSPTGRFVSAP